MYSVGINSCNCHSDECIYDSIDNKIASGMNRDAMEELVRLANIGLQAESKSRT